MITICIIIWSFCFWFRTLWKWRYWRSILWITKYFMFTTCYTVEQCITMHNEYEKKSCSTCINCTHCESIIKIDNRSSRKKIETVTSPQHGLCLLIASGWRKLYTLNTYYYEMMAYFWEPMFCDSLWRNLTRYDSVFSFLFRCLLI